jgi:hypothetical protein
MHRRAFYRSRHLGERDRSPAYHRVRKCLINRLDTERGRQVNIPSPASYNSGGGSAYGRQLARRAAIVLSGKPTYRSRSQNRA